MEVRFCCRLGTQGLTLWPVGTIEHGADPLGITPHISSLVPTKIEHEGSTLLVSSYSAAHLSSQSSAVEAHDQDDALRGLLEPRNRVTQAPHNAPGPSEGVFHTMIPSERADKYPVRTIQRLLLSR